MDWGCAVTTRELFHDIMRQRRQWPVGSSDWAYRTRAARKLVWMMRGIPTAEWSE